MWLSIILIFMIFLTFSIFLAPKSTQDAKQIHLLQASIQLLLISLIMLVERGWVVRLMMVLDCLVGFIDGCFGHVDAASGGWESVLALGDAGTHFSLDWSSIRIVIWSILYICVIPSREQSFAFLHWQIHEGILTWLIIQVTGVHACWFLSNWIHLWYTSTDNWRYRVIIAEVHWVAYVYICLQFLVTLLLESILVTTMIIKTLLSLFRCIFLSFLAFNCLFIIQFPNRS